MSETVHYTGRLVQVYNGDGIESWCKSMLSESGFTDLSYCDTYQERFEDVFYQEYYITNDTVYRVEKHEVDSDREIIQANKNGDGTINFVTRYYNGGCSFTEALDTAFKRMED